MLRREAIVAMRAYTKLPESVQGILERRGEEYDLGGGISRGSSFERVLQTIDVDMFCVSKLRIMRSATVLAGVVEGSFVLRGRAVRLEDSMFAVVSVVAGAVPEDFQNPANTYLLALAEEDFLRCAVPQQLPYGVNTVTDSLAPRWNFISAVYSKKVQHAVVACPNGVFSLRSSAHPSEIGPAKAEELLKNLLDVDVMIEVDAPSPKTIYRVASNCLFVGGDRMHEGVAALQRSLQLPGYVGYSEPPRTLPTSLAYFSVDASLLMTEGPHVDPGAVKTLAPQGSTVQVQSLTKWWTSPASFQISLAATTGAAGQETPVELRTKIKEGAQKEFDLEVSVKAPPFRELRPGETQTGMRSQLKAVVESSLSSAMSDFAAKNVDQGALDALTRTLGETASSNLTAALLFDGSVTVGVKLSFEQAEGETTTLPAGDRVVIPRYACELESARLNAFLGVFTSLGLQGSFTAWPQALRNRLIVL